MTPYMLIPNYVRTRIENKIFWTTVSEAQGSDLEKVVAEIVDLHACGLLKSADLIFHEVWLDESTPPSDDGFRGVTVHGREGEDKYYCAYIDRSDEGASST